MAPLHPARFRSARPYQIIFSGQYQRHADGRIETVPLDEREARQIAVQRQQSQAVAAHGALADVVYVDSSALKIADLRGRTFFSEDAADAALKIALGPDGLEQRIEQMTRHYACEAFGRFIIWNYTWSGSRCHEIEDGDGEIDRKALKKVAKRCIEALIAEGMIPGDKSDYRISVRQPSRFRGWRLIVRIPYEWDVSRSDVEDAMTLAMIPWLSSRAVDKYDDAGAYSQALPIGIQAEYLPPADMPAGMTRSEQHGWLLDRALGRV